MRRYLLFILCLVSHSLVAQLQTDKITPYKDIVFGVTKGSGNSIGSAFIVGKNNDYYYLATAKHVVQDDQEFVLTSLKGSQHLATVVASHAVHDIALLRTPIFALDLDSIPIVTNLSMNDEVAFVSVKDSGKILPSKSPGIVRDVNGESVSVIMKEVESGHSGSPLFSEEGIVAIILKKGRYIECMNIELVNDIISDWSNDSFEKVFVLKYMSQKKLEEPKSMIGQKIKLLSGKVASDAQRPSQAWKLMDGRLDTYETYAIPERQSVDILIEFDELVSVSYFKIYISAQLNTLIPDGYIYLIYNEQSIYSMLSILLSHKEKTENGNWYVYEYVKPILANSVKIILKPKTTGSVTYDINEIEFYGNSL